MNLIDVLVKLETEEVAENLYKEKTKKKSDITELLDSKHSKHLAFRWQDKVKKSLHNQYFIINTTNIYIVHNIIQWK